MEIAVTLSVIGCLGAFSNDMAGALNGGKMPVVAIGYFDGADAAHQIAIVGVRFFYGCDIIPVEPSRIMSLLYPWGSYASVGDLLIMFSAIGRCLVLFAGVVWSLVLVFRNTFQRCGRAL